MKMNRAIRRRKTKPFLLRIKSMEEKKLHIRVYSDASFGTNIDLSSQIGFIVLLCDQVGNLHVLDYASRKAQRVVRSITGGELYAMTEAFDSSFMIRQDLEEVYGFKVPLQMFTDSRQLFDVVTKGFSTSQPRLMINVAALRESYNRFEIDQLVLVRRKLNISDALTRTSPNAHLDEFLDTSCEITIVEQWVERTWTSQVCYHI